MEKETIEIGSDGWNSLLSEIAANYADGSLIKHEWLKEKFGLKKIILGDYESVEDFIKAIDTQQFCYMSLVDRLRWQLLSDYKMFIKNIRGDGYTIIQPKEQVQYAYDCLTADIKKALKEATAIMGNVRKYSDFEQQAKDSDIRAKIGMMKQMFSGIKQQFSPVE